MNKEQQELLGEAYRTYVDSHWISPSNSKGKLLSEQLYSVIPMEHSKESFINEIKTNSKFSKKWGLKIEERELSLEERYDWFTKTYNKNLTRSTNQYDMEDILNTNNIPTKLITITYNDTTIESYES